MKKSKLVAVKMRIPETNDLVKIWRIFMQQRFYKFGNAQPCQCIRIVVWLAGERFIINAGLDHELAQLQPIVKLARPLLSFLGIMLFAQESRVSCGERPEVHRGKM